MLRAIAALAVLPLAALAQQATITGTVKSETGDPLANATVLVERMNVGAQSNNAGEFAIVVPSARVEGQTVTLTARLVGYRPRSMTFVLTPGLVSKDFRMERNPLLLGEIVVTGSGTTSVREKLATSISSVKQEEITKSSESNIVNALAAKAPGVEVTSQAGDPGAGSMIVIRGLKTLQGDGQPLFIVDGQPIDNSSSVTTDGSAGTATTNRASDFNPHDVESVEVLKGAAATMLYGQRASAGVILITTRAGRAGELRYALTSNVSFDEVNRGIPLQRQYTGGSGNVTAGSDCGGGFGCYPSARSWGAPIPAGTPTYDHWGELFRTGSTYDNQLSISGGDAYRTFFLSAGATNQQGVIIGPNNEYNRYTVRLKATQQLTDQLKVGGNVSYADVRARFVQKGNNLNALLLGATRTVPTFDSHHYKTVDGCQISYRYPRPVIGDPCADPVYDNPFWVANEASNSSNVGRIVGNLLLDYQPFNWLKVNYTLGTDYYNDDRTGSMPPGSAGNALSGQLYQSSFTSLQVDHNLLAAGQFEVNRNVQLRVSLGQNLNLRKSRVLQLLGTGFTDPTLLTLNNTIPSNLQPQNFESRTNIAGYFGQLEADLYNQLFLSAAIRADQASSYAPDQRTHLFPKASAAWNVTSTLGNTNQRGLLSFLKARVAYGQVGREPYAYQTLTTFSNAGSLGGYSGVAPAGTLGNVNLSPEITSEIEVGADFGLFNQRVDGGITYYDARTTDVILAIPVASSVGFNEVNKNGARIVNTGIELTLNGRVIDRPALRWEMGINFTRNRSRVTDVLGVDVVGIPGGFGASAAVKAQPLGVYYQTDFVRCRYGVPDADNIQAGSGVPGDDINAWCRANGARDGALFVPAGGYPLADPKSRVTGDPNANYLLGFRNVLTLMKKLSISALIDIRNGAQNWNGTRGALQSHGTHLTTVPRAQRVPAGSGAFTGNLRTFGRDFMPQETTGPGAGTAVQIGENWFRDGIGGGIFSGPGGQLVDDGAYTKLREVSVAWTFDNGFVRKTLSLSSIDVRLSGRNLVTWTNYDGIDPETNLYGATGIGRGIDYFNNPQTRSWVINVTLNR